MKLQALPSIALACDLAKSSLLEFVKQAWHVIEPITPFQLNWHHEVICNHLEAVWPQGKIRQLLITVPPRFTKSLLTSIFWPAWIWIHQPGLRILSASYSGTLSTRDSVRCRRLIESPWYQERWPVELTTDQNQKTRFENEAQGCRIATSVGAATTGEGGHVRILDDPHNILEAHSTAKRREVITWHDEAWSTRTSGPIAKTASVVIMQRCHEGDLAAHLLERGGWAHVCLPMELEPTPRSSSPLSVERRTVPGELLWPTRFGPNEVAALKRALGSYAVAGQFQQRPAPLEGGLLSKAWWRRYAQTPSQWRSLIGSWDPANSLVAKAGHSYTVGLLVGVKPPDYYVLDVVRARLSPLQTEEEIWLRTRIWETRHPTVNGIDMVLEETACGPAVLERLKQRLPRVFSVHPHGSKNQRVADCAPLIEAGNVLLPEVAPWLEDFIEECSLFPNGVHDDQVDALTQALAWAERRRQAQQVVVPVAIAPRDGASWIGVHDNV